MTWDNLSRVIGAIEKSGSVVKNAPKKTTEAHQMSLPYLTIVNIKINITINRGLTPKLFYSDQQNRQRVEQQYNIPPRRMLHRSEFRSIEIG